jgi:hypothetical protein
MSTKKRVNGPKRRGQTAKAQPAAGLAEVARVTNRLWRKHHLRRKAALIFSGMMGWMLLRSPATLIRRRALCRAARPKGAPLGPGKRSRD